MDTHCSCCTTRLGLGPRRARILLYLMRHPEWEADVMLEGLWFKFLRGRDRTRVSWKPEYKARLELELTNTGL